MRHCIKLLPERDPHCILSPINNGYCFNCRGQPARRRMPAFQQMAEIAGYIRVPYSGWYKHNPGSPGHAEAPWNETG